LAATRHPAGRHSGGAISSTATTVSYARGTRDDALAARTAAIIIMIASTVMYLRVLLAVSWWRRSFS